MALKRISLILSLILLLTGLLGCQQKEEIKESTVAGKDVEIANEPTITGEITEIEENEFLVISKTEKLPNGDPDSIWFTTDDIEPLKIGQTVSVWATFINDSFPGQAGADKIEIVSLNKSVDNTSLNIADFYGEYTFDEVAYISPTINEEEYQDVLKAVTETFTDVEFTIGESYFYETSGIFGENPSEGFEFITLQDYDDLVGENFDDFESLSSLFDYDGIKKELDVNEIKHYIMYVEGGILSNPAFYITKDNIFVANETISYGETDDTLKGYTHYLVKLKEK